MIDITGGSLQVGWSRLSVLHVFARFDQEVTGSSVRDADQSIEAQIVLLGFNYALGSGIEGRIVVPAGQVVHETPDEDQSLSGFGDIDLQVTYRLSELWLGTEWAPRVTIGTGLRLPTGVAGRTGSDVAEAEIAQATGETIVPPTLLALGSGAFGLTGNLIISQPLHATVILNIPFRFRLPLTYNNTGVRFGFGFDYGLGFSFRLGGGVSLTTDVSGRFLDRAREREKGEVLQSGGQWFAAEAGLGWAATERLAIGFRVRLPFYQVLNGTQLTERVSVYSVLAWRFGNDNNLGSIGPVAPYLESPEGVDDLAKGGEAFDAMRAAIPGKVTIVDFWGEWCEFCKNNTAALITFQKQYSASVALRRVEVPDFDSPVATKNLAGIAGLPHVWIFDQKGVRRHVVANRTDCERIPEFVRALLAE